VSLRFGCVAPPKETPATSTYSTDGASAPGKRPRTTRTPTLAFRNDAQHRLGFGTPVVLPPRLGEETMAVLRARGHDVVVEDPWSLGRLSAVRRDRDGLLRAAANPRGMQGYAVGR